MRGGERRRYLSPNRGFTLVELIMVIAIVGIVAAMAAPRWNRSMCRWQVDAAGRRLADDLAWAQSRARLTSSSQTVQLNPSAATYTLVGIPDPDHPNAVYTVNVGQPPYRCTLLFEAAGSPTAQTIAFDGFGNLTAGGRITITSGDFSQTITLVAGTSTISPQ